MRIELDENALFLYNEKNQRRGGMITQVFSLRGATTVDADTKDEVIEKTTALMAALFTRNNLNDEQFEIINVIVSTTADIKSHYPARAIREGGMVVSSLFSAQEPEITGEGALSLCIRVMVTVANSGTTVSPQHVYLEKAAALRPDLVEKFKNRGRV